MGPSVAARTCYIHIISISDACTLEGGGGAKNRTIGNYPSVYDLVLGNPYGSRWQTEVWFQKMTFGEDLKDNSASLLML